MQPQRLKPALIMEPYAALKRRSSTGLPAFRESFSDLEVVPRPNSILSGVGDL
jgi:hypothetical protein